MIANIAAQPWSTAARSARRWAFRGAASIRYQVAAIAPGAEGDHHRLLNKPTIVMPRRLPFHGRLPALRQHDRLGLHHVAAGAQPPDPEVVGRRWRDIGCNGWRTTP